MAGGSVRAIEDGGKRPWLSPDVSYPPGLRARARALAEREAARARITIARGVRTLSESYTRERDQLDALPATTARYVGGLGFFFARDFPKALAVFDELAVLGLVPAVESLRILDLGAGFGTTSLGVARYCRATGFASKVSIDAVERDAGALERMRSLAAPSEELPALELRTHAQDLDAYLAGDTGRYELVLLGLALNELAPSLDARRALLLRAIERLAPGGVLLVIEPALHATARSLMEVRDALLGADGVAVLGPCTHDLPCPMLRAGERDWCHVELPLELPAEEAALARDAGLRDVKPTFAWLALGRERARPVDVTLHRLVSRALASKGKHEMHACGAGELRKVVALERDRLDPPLDTLRRGGLVALEQAALPLGTSVRLGRDAALRVVTP